MSSKTTIIARVLYVNQVETVGERGFQKRTVILDDSRTKDGTTYPNYIPVEFTGDRMAQLDHYSQGQLVQVEAFVEGREHNGRYFVTIKGWIIAPYQSQQTYQHAPQQPQYAQQPSFQQGPQQPQYAQQTYQQAPQQPNAYQQRMREQHTPDMFYSKSEPQMQGNPFGPAPARNAGPAVDPLPFQ